MKMVFTARANGNYYSSLASLACAEEIEDCEPNSEELERHYAVRAAGELLYFDDRDTTPPMLSPLPGPNTMMSLPPWMPPHRPRQYRCLIPSFLPRYKQGGFVRADPLPPPPLVRLPEKDSPFKGSVSEFSWAESPHRMVVWARLVFVMSMSVRERSIRSITLRMVVWARVVNGTSERDSNPMLVLPIIRHTIQTAIKIQEVLTHIPSDADETSETIRQFLSDGMYHGLLVYQLYAISFPLSTGHQTYASLPRLPVCSDCSPLF